MPGLKQTIRYCPAATRMATARFPFLRMTRVVLDFLAAAGDRTTRDTPPFTNVVPLDIVKARDAGSGICAVPEIP